MSDLDDLSARLKEEFQAAKDKVVTIQSQAMKSYDEQKARYDQFVVLLKDIAQTIVRPRVDKLMEFYDNLERTPQQHRHGGDVVLSFQKTPNCLANVKLKLSGTHDASIENVVFSFDLEIIPVFIEYERHSVFTMPMAEPDRAAFTKWLDDRLVAFTKTYLSLQFNDQYQRSEMVTDPVSGTRFPKSFAQGTKNHLGAVYYFISPATMSDFEKNPQQYLN